VNKTRTLYLDHVNEGKYTKTIC